MKRLILFTIVIVMATLVNAQNYNLVVGTRFQGRSFDELLTQAQLQAAAAARNEERFQEYQDRAYSALNRGDRAEFITYSNYALKTGWHSAKLYYDRGKAFQYLEDYKNAKKEFKKAKKNGYYQAEAALKELKSIKKHKK